MTRIALQRAVCSLKREIRHRVAKRSDFPEMLLMAVSAIRKCSPVDVIFSVAGSAHLREACEFAVILMALAALKSVVHATESVALMEINSI